MSVAESIVILPPIAHVGCASACSTVTPSSSARAAPAERPARGGQDEPLDGAGRLAATELVQRRVLGVDGQDLRARGLGELHDQLAADDERLLVGQRQVDALPQRGHRRAQPGGADERVEHEVGARVEHQAHEPLGADQHLAVRPRLGRAGAGVGVGQRDPRDAVLGRLRDERLPRALGRQPDQLELLGARDDVERLRADRAGRAEDEQAPGHAAILGADRRGSAGGLVRGQPGPTELPGYGPPRRGRSIRARCSLSRSRGS